jgi:hypothetical protein
MRKDGSVIWKSTPVKASIRILPKIVTVAPTLPSSCPSYVNNHCYCRGFGLLDFRAIMSAAIWPPIGDDELVAEQAASQARELEWLLVQLRETLQSLKAGLEECAALLAPSENGSTLVLTSVRSESLKGLITRIGTRITKGVCWSLLYDFVQELTGCTECQASHRKPPSSTWLAGIRPHHLVCTSSTDTGHTAAYVDPDLDQQLPGRYRRSDMGRRCDQGGLRRWTAAASTREHTGSTTVAERLLGRAVAVVGTTSR